jgi:predicted dinucleotide-binding enzyme
MPGAVTRFTRPILADRSNLFYLECSPNSNDLEEDPMRISILGTGRVAQSLAAGLLRAGHDVVFGSREPEHRAGLPAPALASAEAVVGADVVLNAVQGVDTLPLLASIGADRLDGVVLWDLANAANPDFSVAIPDDSLGRRIQEAFPAVKVVKAANQVAAVVVADPNTLPAPTTLFLSGDDGDAKEVVSGLLADLGWPRESMFDLGDITNAYGQEHYLALFGSVLQRLGTPYFNIAIVSAAA